MSKRTICNVDEIDQLIRMGYDYIAEDTYQDWQSVVRARTAESNSGIEISSTIDVMIALKRGDMPGAVSILRQQHNTEDTKQLIIAIVSTFYKDRLVAKQFRTVAAGA